MKTYKIINITSELDKRHPQYNSNLIITYVDDMMNKNAVLEPKKSIYLRINKLPLSVYQLKIDGLVRVIEMPILKKETRGVKKEKTIKKKKTTSTKKAEQSKTKGLTTSTTKSTPKTYQTKNKENDVSSTKNTNQTKKIGDEDKPEKNEKKESGDNKK